jgi:hypothetical protein
MYTSCVLGLRPSALFNEFFTYQKKNCHLMICSRLTLITTYSTKNLINQELT